MGNGDVDRLVRHARDRVARRGVGATGGISLSRFDYFPDILCHRRHTGCARIDHATADSYCSKSARIGNLTKKSARARTKVLQAALREFDICASEHPTAKVTSDLVQAKNIGNESNRCTRRAWLFTTNRNRCKTSAPRPSRSRAQGINSALASSGNRRRNAARNRTRIGFGRGALTPLMGFSLLSHFQIKKTRRRVALGHADSAAARQGEAD